MNSGDVVDLELADFIEYAKVGAVAPIGSPDDILKVDFRVKEHLAKKNAVADVSYMPPSVGKNDSFLI
jgi:hypothetical protein